MGKNSENRRRYIVDVSKCSLENNPLRLTKIPMIDGCHYLRFDILENEMPAKVVKQLREIAYRSGYYRHEALELPMGTNFIAPGAEVRDAETGKLVWRSSKKWRCVE
jgi:hypothetical protein